MSSDLLDYYSTLIQVRSVCRLQLNCCNLILICTAILGLTVLALGNCVADWVADTVVARGGKPEMAVASCFGSPMLSHVLGLSVAMIVRPF